MTHELVQGYPVVIEIPVQWGEMDAYGHVNNTVFFRYFESVRVVFLDRCGFLESYDRERVGAILHSTSCRFRLPLFYPDTVLVGARATHIGEDRFSMGYAVVSRAQDALAAEGDGVVVSYDYERRVKAPLPERVLQGLAQLEAEAGGATD